MLLIYTVLFYLLIPVIMIRLLWRSYRLPAYRHNIFERFGWHSKKFDQSIWVHAVSVGEVIAALPLIHALTQRYSTIPIIVTTMTPTGRERIHRTFGGKIHTRYLPYDLPGAIHRFLQSTKPLMGIIVETELWPNLLRICQNKTIPIVLANARLSAISCRRYQSITWITKNMLPAIAQIAAISPSDANRFITIGAKSEQVVVTGNIKFDLTLPETLWAQSEELRTMLGRDRLIWIAASTHHDEETIILNAHQQLRSQYPHLLLILAPRHPERFNNIFTLCQKYGLTIRRSQAQGALLAETAIFLGDTMGELMLLYSVSDIVFVGGSLIPHGGHNFIEPASLSKPMLTGPHFFNFETIGQQFITANALTVVQDAETLTTALHSILQNETLRQTMGQNAAMTVNANRGALAKHMTIIENFLPTPHS